MMPQKKNPDIFPNSFVARRGGPMVTSWPFLTTLKGLPLAYNKDLQEDKEGFF